jgi:hypothetical protein
VLEVGGLVDNGDRDRQLKGLCVRFGGGRDGLGVVDDEAQPGEQWCSLLAA